MINYKSCLRILIVMSLSLALWYLGSATWIYGKAYVATFLINDAWQLTLKNGGINKSWSWADTWPVAEISIPSIGLNEIVLAGDSGATLAFGPGLSGAGATLDRAGVKLVSGHRDTHFSKLETIAINDDIYIQTPAGTKHYRVNAMKVVDARSYTIDTANNDYDLVLATCYPFDAISPNGYERFIVQAYEASIDEINNLNIVRKAL